MAPRFSFVGTVREVNDGRPVQGIEYAAYEAMAERELEQIAREAAAQFGTVHIVVEHRLGSLALGEVSVAIAVAHPHRGAAYEASRFVIEELKRRVPIWKREDYADGTREWVDPTTIGVGVRAMTTLHDQFGRRIEYLRISVTDRCNFRCVYCMPLEGLPWLPKQEILSYEEITAIVAQLAPLGLRRLRITGGEPTIRPELPTLIADAAGRAGHRGHRALDEWRAPARDGGCIARGGTGSRQHERRLATPRADHGDRPTVVPLRSGGRRHGGRGGGSGADQAERRRDAWHQRRRDRRLCPTDARASMARPVHRAHAGGRSSRADLGPRGAERRDHRAARSSRPDGAHRRSDTWQRPRRRTIASPVRPGRWASSRR